MDSRLQRSITLQFHCFLLFLYLKMSFFFSFKFGLIYSKNNSRISFHWIPARRNGDSNVKWIEDDANDSR